MSWLIVFCERDLWWYFTSYQDLSTVSMAKQGFLSITSEHFLSVFRQSPPACSIAVCKHLSPPSANTFWNFSGLLSVVLRIMHTDVLSLLLTDFSNIFLISGRLSDLCISEKIAVAPKMLKKCHPTESTVLLPGWNTVWIKIWVIPYQTIITVPERKCAAPYSRRDISVAKPEFAYRSLRSNVDTATFWVFYVASDGWDDSLVHYGCFRWTEQVKITWLDRRSLRLHLSQVIQSTS